MKKRIVWLLLTALLCTACGTASDGQARLTKTAPAAAETVSVPESTSDIPVTLTPEPSEKQEEPAADVPATTPEPSAESIMDIPMTLPPETPVQQISEPGTAVPAIVPDLSGLPVVKNVYTAFGLYPTQGDLFTFDLDYDGTPEEIRFTADYENGTATIHDGDRSIEIPYVGQLLEFTLIDLDPETPYANIMVSVEISYQNNMTVILHPEGGKLVEYTFFGNAYAENGDVIIDENSMLLGFRSGWCTAHGETLTPDSLWRKDDQIPTEDEIEDDLKGLAGLGILLKLKRDLPCVIDGKDSVIKKDNYLYVLRFSDALKQVEVKTIDGVTAIISFTGEAWLSYDIDEIPQEEYFVLLPEMG